MTLRDVLASKEVVVVCGSGGVGKTTAAASIALDAASDRKVIVVTIDPARRLASALGLDGGIGHKETLVDLNGSNERSSFDARGVRGAQPPGAKGTLHAAMLDMKTAWDDLVDRYSPTRAQASHIKTNRIYRSLSEQFVGSQSYMAMERLADLHDRGNYDLIVIDTPPTRSALDFLEAPKRMTDFIGGSLLRWMAKPYSAAGKIGLRAFNFTASPFLKIADRVLGSQVLEDMSALVLDFQNLYDGFKERAEDVLQLLSSPATGFLVVTSLEEAPLKEAEFFVDRLRDEQLPLAGVVANKVLPERFAEPDEGPKDAEQAAQAANIDVDRARRALEDAETALATIGPLARRDKRSLAELHKRAGVAVAHVPLLTHDVHDLDGLRELAGYVFGTGGVSGSGTRG